MIASLRCLFQDSPRETLLLSEGVKPQGSEEDLGSAKIAHQEATRAMAPVGQNFSTLQLGTGHEMEISS